MFVYINNNDITMVAMLSKSHFLYYNSVMSVASVVCMCMCKYRDMFIIMF